jgi:hypothetical protein
MEFSSEDGMDGRAEVDATLHGVMQNCRIEKCSGLRLHHDLSFQHDTLHVHRQVSTAFRDFEAFALL